MDMNIQIPPQTLQITDRILYKGPFVKMYMYIPKCKKKQSNQTEKEQICIKSSVFYLSSQKKRSISMEGILEKGIFISCSNG